MLDLNGDRPPGARWRSTAPAATPGADGPPTGGQAVDQDRRMIAYGAEPAVGAHHPQVKVLFYVPVASQVVQARSSA
ncbi:hypothetical protein GCM10022226_74040 [Sphaerisporangium flaviroseum]|uniref:Uncharacterized protein n=1 Tax=Sphaerisporangium flaviroseum TaxID=509199 RepID=A0ABP7JCT6_9ACTN